MMAKNLFKICLISLIVQQISWANPLNDLKSDNINDLKTNDLCRQQSKYEDMEPNEKDKLLTPTNQLLKFTLHSFQELSLKYAKKAKVISENLLKDTEILNSNSPKLQEFKQNLTHFHEKYSLCDGIDELFDLVELYSNTTSFYYELEEASLDSDQKLLLRLLRKYGSEDLDDDFEKHFNVFVENFVKKLESLTNELREENGEIGKMVLDWYVTFKKLDNYDDKIAAFEKYFAFYEEQEEKEKE